MCGGEVRLQNQLAGVELCTVIELFKDMEMTF